MLTLEPSDQVTAPCDLVTLLHLHLLQELPVLAPEGRVVGELCRGRVVVVLVVVAVFGSDGGPPPPVLTLLTLTLGPCDQATAPGDQVTVSGDQVTAPGDHLEVMLGPGSVQGADVDVLWLVL